MNIFLRNLVEITSLFFVSLILFTWGLNAGEVIGFESRFYLFALEMWRNGFNWFPTTYQHFYPDYPVTSTYLIYIFAKVYGELNKWIAVLPTAITAAITVVLTYLIGALQAKRWGIFAVVFMFCTITFLKTARSIELDMYGVMITTTCFYLIYSADIFQQPSRVYFIFPLLILGFAFRGPIGLIIPTGVICSYYLLDKRLKNFLLIGFSALFLLLICTMSLLYLAYLTGGKTFAHEVWQMQVIGRIDNAYEPAYFYFTNGLKNLAISFPLALFALFGMIFYLPNKSAEIQFIFKLIAWIAIILVGMSIPGDKKIRYVLPILPATSLIAAYFFIAPSKHHYFKLIHAILLKFFLYLPLLFLIAIEFVWILKNKDILDFIRLPFIIFLLVAQIINIFIFQYVSNKKQKEIFILLLSTFIFVMIYINLIEPIEMHVDRAKQFVQQIESARMKQHASLVFYKEKPDGLPIKYLINAVDTPRAIFINHPDQLNQFAKTAFFIASDTYFLELPENMKKKFRVIAQNKLGHTSVVVFAKG